MDVFSLLKFWRTSASPDQQLTKHFNDDEDSFFDLVFTKSGHVNEYNNNTSDFICLNHKRRILPLDSPNTKPTQSVHSPLRLLKLGFKNDKSMKPETKTTERSSSKTEEVKISVLLKRDNSLRHQLTNEKLLEHDDKVTSKRFSKDVINKYFNYMKPSYVKGSKRCTEKWRLWDSSMTLESEILSPRKDERKSGGRMGFRDVCKNLGKSRSSSGIMLTPARKSDDSILQQDGIQGAILHCKRSFNSPSQDYLLLRSGSAPSNNQALVPIEQNRSSI